MEKCFMSEKNYVLKYYLKKGVKHCYCVRKSVKDASKQHYFYTFEHPCRGIPLINVEKWILTLFSCDVALYRFIRA